MDVKSAEDLLSAKKLIFPGVGSFGSCVERLKQKGLFDALKEYCKSGKPYLGICLGLQV